MVRSVQRGFRFSALARFQQHSGLPLDLITDLLRLPPRTLMRRKAQGRLFPDESERLLRVAEVYEKALDLFESDAQQARHWLTTPNAQLDNIPPLEFAQTEIGAREVQDLLGRLEHGVFA